MKIKRNNTPVPQEVIDHVRKYLEEMKYELLEVVRQSDHPDDDYLYMVKGKSMTNGWYAVWTCWNEKARSLNYGYYMLDGDEACDKVFKKYFHRIEGPRVDD